MAESRWVYRKSDGVFLRGGFYDPSYASATEGVVAFQDADPHPDVVLDRFDSAAGKRRATAAELSAAKPADGPGFIAAIQAGFPRARLHAFLQKYPVAGISLCWGTWANLKTDVDAALVAAVITVDEYNAFVAAARANRIPGW